MQSCFNMLAGVCCHPNKYHGSKEERMREVVLSSALRSADIAHYWANTALQVTKF